ncbi:unnamed protein product, partial [Schistosoma curassoni]|uniref:IRS-type PTB domain-containing protein n=1 Tax=Schistosoma curassoni TaxID=6186 RepID=A0A183KBX0_9TREM
EQSTNYRNEHLSPQLISTNCHCKYLRKSLFSRTFYKKFKNYWAVLLISFNNHNHNDEYAFLVLFKTHTKQLIPWSSILSSQLNKTKMYKTQLLFNSPNYYSASRCKVLRIQDACFDNNNNHNNQPPLKGHCIHQTVLVLENHSNKEKVYRLMSPIVQYSCIQSMTCKNSNRSSSKVMEHADQFGVALNSDIQITNNTHRDLLPSWSWTTKTVHRFSQIIKQKFGTISKINRNKYDLSSNITTTTTTNIPPTTTNTTTTTPTTPSNDYLLNKSFQWLLPLLTLFPSTSQQVSKHMFQTPFLNLSTIE